MRKLFGLILFTIPVLASPGFAQEAPEAVVPAITGGVSTSFESRYLWYVLLCGGGAVQQSSAWLSSEGYTLSVWNNIVLANGENHGKTDEIDYSLCRTVEYRGITLEPGFSWWTYPNQNTPSTKVLTLAVSKEIGPLSLRTNHVMDISEDDGAYYADLTLSHGWEPRPGLSLQASVGVGTGNRKFNETYIGPRKTAFNTSNIGLEASFVACGVTVTPHVTWSALVDKDLRDAVDKPNVFVYGITAEKEW